MKRVMVAAFFVVGLVAVGVGVAGINGNWSTHSNGSMEVPVRDSQGQAQAIFHLSNDGSELDFKLIATNIEGVTQSHIHCGPEGVNGPVVVFLYGFNAAGVAPNGILNEGTITDANVIAATQHANLSGRCCHARRRDREDEQRRCIRERAHPRLPRRRDPRRHQIGESASRGRRSAAP